MSVFPREMALLTAGRNFLLFCFARAVPPPLGLPMLPNSPFGVCCFLFFGFQFFVQGSYVASFMLSLEIQIMNFFYRKVAVWTTERENHRTDTVFEDTLIAKLAVFQVDWLID